MADESRPAEQKSQSAEPRLDLISDLPVELEVRLGSVTLPFGELLQMRHGSILTIGDADGQQAELLAGGKVVARGEMVTTDDQLAIRVQEILGTDVSGED